jgi:hypothetical protein
MDVAEAISRVQSALENLGTDCAMEEVAGLCPDLTWNQVFLAIDHLSRSGKIRMTLIQGRNYAVQAIPTPNPLGRAVSHVSS